MIYIAWIPQPAAGQGYIYIVFFLLILTADHNVYAIKWVLVFREPYGLP